MRPYIIYPDSDAVKQSRIGSVIANCLINQPGEVSFGTIDYIPGWYIPLHHHNTWELIIIDSSSEGPGYTLFDGHWWRADRGCGVFIPKGTPHAWSSGNEKGFKMLWIYGGSHEEAGRFYDTDPLAFRAITPDQENSALTWTPFNGEIKT